MKFICLLILIGLPILAQDIKGVADARMLATTASTSALTITATSGDGATCKLNKVSNGNISASISCNSADGKTGFNNMSLKSSSTTTSDMLFGLGDVLCLLGINPTATSVTMGSLGSIPAKGIAWSCTTNISTGGQTAPVNGSVSWP